MLEALVVFACQYAYVACLGLQSRNVQHGNYAAAALVSTCLGTMGLTITVVVARTAVVGGGWPVWIAFVAAGPAGIVSAMKFDSWWRDNDRRNARDKNSWRPD